jgi:hypothetical protein
MGLSSESLINTFICVFLNTLSLRLASPQSLVTICLLNSLELSLIGGKARYFKLTVLTGRICVLLVTVRIGIT